VVSKAWRLAQWPCVRTLPSMIRANRSRPAIFNFDVVSLVTVSIWAPGRAQVPNRIAPCSLVGDSGANRDMTH
jgi:hypothetical protein